MKKEIADKKIRIISAKRSDYLRISRFINSKSMENILLRRSPQQILELWKNFSLAIVDEKIIGIVGFKVWPDNQPEIISLAVNDAYRGMGIGSRLVEHSLGKVKKRGFRSVFALTTAVALFKKAGFRKASIKKFPHKAWADCRHCPRNIGGPDDPSCNEVVLCKKL